MLKATEILSKEEIQELLKPSDMMGVWSICWNWLLIFSSYVAIVHFPNPIVILFGILIIAGRQLGLLILMHDCSHDSLFASKKLNKFFGDYLCAAPMFVHMEGYRFYHRLHHQKAGTEGDPDLANYRNYPISNASFKRKLKRDILGITGVKNFLVLMAMNLGILDYNLAFGAKQSQKKRLGEILQGFKERMIPMIVFHSLMFSALYQMDYLFLGYGIWMATYLTVYMVVLRIRNIAEHAAPVDAKSRDPRLHTRTTYANLLERLTVAPNFVNFHLEHHFLPAVPGYKLPKLHQMLKDREAIPEGSIFFGYLQVIRHLTYKN